MSYLERVRAEVPNIERQRLYRRAVIIAMAGNAILAIAKGLLAWASGSSAIFSDAANSLSDTLYSLLMGGGLYLSQRPADTGHPQGHGRFEPFVSLFIATAMATAGGTAVWQAIRRWHRAPQFLEAGKALEIGWPTMVLVGSILMKVGMYALVRRVGEKAESPAIQASARDNLADVLTSAAALIGIWGARMIDPILDPVAGLIVGLWIFRATWEIAWENLGYLTGRGASPELSEHIAAVASEVPGVERVHRVIAEYVGPQLRIDMHINVDGKTSLERAHAIADRVQENVERLPEVDLAFIHVEPTISSSVEPGDDHRK
jgi:cation diffusion facilitator family transporter